jgi:stage V sporulation protein B
MQSNISGGTFLLILANAVFIVSGYAVHFGLGRYMGPREYGTFGVLLSLLTMTQFFFQNGIPQSVSKYVSEGRNVRSVRMEALGAQGRFLLAITLVYALSAPAVAYVLGDLTTTYYILLTALVLPFRSVSEVDAAVLNGLREFSLQAKALAYPSVARAVLIVAFILAGFGLGAVVAAYIIAAVLGMLLCMHWVNGRSGGLAGGKIERSKLTGFAAPVLVFAFSYIAVLSVDLIFVKSLSKDPADAGYYTAAGIIGRFPFYAFYPLSYTLFPYVSEATQQKSWSRLRLKVHKSLRYLLMILVPAVALVWATSSSLLSTIYPWDYARGGAALGILTLGNTFMIVFITLATIISAMGMPKTSMFYGLLALAISLILNLAFVGPYGMAGAATATAGASFIAMALAYRQVEKRLKPLIDPGVAAKILISSAIIFVIARSLAVPGILLVVEYPMLGLVYVSLLFAFGEIKREDIDIVKALMPSRGVLWP